MSAAPGSKHVTTAKKLMFTVLAKPCEIEVCLTVLNVHLKCTSNLKSIFFKNTVLTYEEFICKNKVFNFQKSCFLLCYVFIVFYCVG